MNTKLLHRLAWKELRTLRPLWLSLLGMALILQLAIAWIVGHFWAPYQVLFIVALWFPSLYSLACASMAFAGEREEGTDQLLSRLAVPPLALLTVKLVLNVLGTGALLAVLGLFTWVLWHWGLDSRFGNYDIWERHGPLNSMKQLALIWGVNLFSWGVFCSLLFQRVTPCLVAALLATWLVNLMQFSPGTPIWLDWTIKLALIPGALLLASVWLVQTWDEDRWPRTVERLLEMWRRVTATGGRLTESSRATERLSGGWRAVVRPFGLCWPDEWLSAWRRETRRLLWLEWRQARRVMLFVLAAFGVYIACQRLFVAWGSALMAKEFPFVMALVSFVFGAWSFQAQQSGQRFRGFARHGASPATMWFIKQGVWFAVTLLTMVIVASIAAWLSGGRHFVSWEPDHESLWRRLGYGLSSGELANWNPRPQLQNESLGGVVSSSVLAVGLCFGVGQLVSLLMTRAVTAATVGFVLAALAFGWQQLTALAAIPPVLAVLPLIVGLLLASAVRMTDWLEERNSLRGWLRVIAACVVPSLVTLIGVPIYRVEEVPPMVDAGFNGHDLQPLRISTTDVSPDAKQTAQRWIRLAESLEGQPRFRRKVLVFPNAVTGVVEEEQATIPYPSDIHLGFVAWKTLTNRDWLTQNASQVSEAACIAQQLDCAFDRELFRGENDESGVSERRLGQLAVLLKMAAESAIAEGKLGESLQHGLVLLRLSEHMQQNILWAPYHNGERLELAAWSFLNRWARHPAQTGDLLRAALGRPTSATPHPLLESLKTHVEMLPPPSQAVVEEYLATKQDLKRHWREVGWSAAWMIWEQQREERLVDYSAAVAMEDMHQWVKDSRENWEGDARLVRRSSVVNHLPSRKRTLAAFWQDSTRNPNAVRRHNLIWTGEYSFDFQRANERGEASVWRRGLVATLALRAFQLDHGHWPAQWDDLIGPYLDRVPVDPWTGLPFELRPQGYPFEIEIFGSRIPAHTPLFVSRGQYDQRFVPIIRQPVNGETSTTTEWFSVCPIEVDPQPIKGSTRTLSLIAFPLSKTEP